MIYSIAIDGPSGAGKSTIAKAVAKKLGISYIDTGAIYRTIGLNAFKNGIEATDAENVAAMLPNVNIDIKFIDGIQNMFLNGENVTSAIREHVISHYASAVSAVPEVRAFLLELQRSFAKTQSVVMDGRDIGTVVLPNATVKIYLTATPEVRAQRRYDELRAKGTDIDYETVLSDIKERDYRDTNRKTAPLKPAEDSIIVDSSDYNLDEAISKVIDTVTERIR